MTNEAVDEEEKESSWIERAGPPMLNGLGLLLVAVVFKQWESGPDADNNLELFMALGAIALFTFSGYMRAIGAARAQVAQAQQLLLLATISEDLRAVAKRLRVELDE